MTRNVVGILQSLTLGDKTAGEGGKVLLAFSGTVEVSAEDGQPLDPAHLVAAAGSDGSDILARLTLSAETPDPAPAEGSTDANAAAAPTTAPAAETTEGATAGTGDGDNPGTAATGDDQGSPATSAAETASPATETLAPGGDAPAETGPVTQTSEEP